MRRFLKKLSLPLGTRYAILTTEGYVTATKGPLEEGWEKKLEAFEARLPSGA